MTIVHQRVGRHRVTSPEDVKVLKEREVGKYLVQVYELHGEFVYRVLVKAERGPMRILDASRHDEDIFPAKAAKAGSQMVEEMKPMPIPLIPLPNTLLNDTHKVKRRRTREHPIKMTPNDGKGNALLSAWTDNHRLDEGGADGSDSKDTEQRKGDDEGNAGSDDRGRAGTAGNSP